MEEKRLLQMISLIIDETVEFNDLSKEPEEIHESEKVAEIIKWHDY